MGFQEKLQQERRALEQANAQKEIQEQEDLRNQEKIKNTRKQEGKKRIEEGREGVRQALGFLRESGIPEWLQEAKNNLKIKGFNHIELQISEKKFKDFFVGYHEANVGDYPYLINEGDVIVHMRWEKLNRNWSGQDLKSYVNIDPYRGPSLSVSSDGTFIIPNSMDNSFGMYYEKSTFALNVWHNNKNVLEDALWKACQNPFSLDYKDVQNRKRLKANPSPPESRGWNS